MSMVQSENPVSPGSSINYLPLNPSTREIRLVVVQPERDLSAPVEVYLIYRTLEDAPERTREAQMREFTETAGGHLSYYALSYVWGDQNITRPIRVDGIEVAVTTNLESALRHIRQESCEITLWVDALCINQKDILEKQSQILMMRSIYECAFCVMIWLGEEFPGTTAVAIDFIERHVTIDFSDCSIDDDLIQTKDNPGYAEAWDAVGQDLLKRQWWSRIWVTQEIACGRRPIVFCGRRSVSWDKLVIASVFACNYVLPIFYSSEEDHMKDMSKGGSFRMRPAFMHGYRSRRAHGRPIMLQELLINNILSFSTDPRDMIFALRGIATDVQGAPELNPDYSRSVRQVYSDFVRFSVNKYQTLDIICLSSHPKAHGELPSWVPDWSNARDRGSAYLPSLTADDMEESRYIYRASGDSCPVTEFSEQMDTLRVSGAYVDAIVTIGELCIMNAGFLNVLERWMYLAIGEMRERARQCYVRGGIMMDAFNRTITADRTLFRTRAQVGQRGFEFEVTEAPDSYREGQGLSAEERQNLWEKDALQSISLASMGRRLFITQHGYLGLGAHDVQVGDMVYVLLGCSVPVVLRKEGSFYRFVGESFVTGIMDGEVMDDIKKGTTELQNLVLR